MTYAELKSLIQNYLQNTETSFTTYLPDMIKQAEDRILENVQLPVFRKNQSGAVTSGNQYLGIPSDFLAPYSLSYTSSSNQTFLINKDVNWIREVYPNASTEGEPEYYAIFSNDFFIVAPTPDSGYTVELHYFYRPASITAGEDSESTWLSTNAPAALLYACLIEGYVYMKGEQDMMSVYNARYESALGRLKVMGDARDRKDAYRSGQLTIPTS
tara:strand:+ start:322 stop:963 length:642 start_codon:yes stop_codon:yes gene_type:complete